MIPTWVECPPEGMQPAQTSDGVWYLEPIPLLKREIPAQKIQEVLWGKPPRGNRWTKKEFGRWVTLQGFPLAEEHIATWMVWYKATVLPCLAPKKAKNKKDPILANETDDMPLPPAFENALQILRDLKAKYTR